MMDKLISNFANQLLEGITIGEKARLSASSQPIHNILICGLGGSGIGGTIISELVSKEIPVPITTCNGYFIPAFVNENTLVIISSYSGNTEETLQCMEQAIEKKAKITCITSGGKAEALAKQHQLDVILVPGGMPPRSCLGYSLVQQLFILIHHKLISAGFISQLKTAISLLEAEEENIKKIGKEVARKLENKLPVIYTTSGNEGIAIRFRQQLNENSKILCWHHVIPEMNHNELVGWTQKNEQLAVVLFRDPQEYERNNTRIAINKGVIEKYTSTFIEIYSKGSSPLEKAIYLIHLGDWISMSLAEIRGVDAVEVNVINFLKSELTKS